jgi:hypothetical protein
VGDRGRGEGQPGPALHAGRGGEPCRRGLDGTNPHASYSGRRLARLVSITYGTPRRSAWLAVSVTSADATPRPRASGATTT